MQMTRCSRSTISRLPVSPHLHPESVPNLISNVSFHGHSRVRGLGTRLEASSGSAAAKLGEADIIHGESSRVRNSEVRPSECYLGKQRALHARPRRPGVWLYAYICASRGNYVQVRTTFCRPFLFL